MAPKETFIDDSYSWTGGQELPVIDPTKAN